MKSLLIGGAGFIGSSLARNLAEIEGSNVQVLDNLTMGNGLNGFPNAAIQFEQGNAEESTTCGNVIQKSQPHVIYHLAANSDIAKSAQDPEIDVRDTFATTAALALELSRNPRPDCTLVFSSTSAVFGEQEGRIGNGTRKSPASSYGWMKLASERLLKQLAETGAIGKLVIVRFPNVTGAGQTHGVVKDLVAKYLGEGPWVILGDGSQDKPYLHVSDLVAVLGNVDRVFTSPGIHELNLAPDSSTTVSSIVEMIEAVGGLNRTPQFGKSPQGWPGDVTKYSYDTGHLAALGINLPKSDDAVLRSIREEFQRHGR